MNLQEYESKQVIIQTPENKIFRGNVVEYFSAEINENNKESIVLRDVKTNALIELYEEDIKSIEIVK
ncbi:MAG: hypothetical protein GX928_06190 [Ruminococcaceae bacterium]|nr:hypothetical protein [Oscillospiraceae bacterium]